MTQTATSPQRKPVLDEASFQQLLRAAYVLQEHNDRLRAKEGHSDFAKNLSAIVETQKLIQTLQLDLEAAAKLVAERAQKITSASGAAIGIFEKGQLVYRAGTGSAAMDQGTRVAPDASLSADCLNHGSSLNYPDAIASSPNRAQLFRGREVKSFIAVPVYHAGQVAGVLELRFARANAFSEADVRTAELMAGLLSEAMVTAARMKWKDALASERQSMLEALERIKPQLERLGTESSSEDAVAESPRAPIGLPAAPPKSQPFGAPALDTCSVCGSNFFSESESFCGICGTARAGASSPSAVSDLDDPDEMDVPWLTPYGAEHSSNGGGRTASPAAAPAPENAGAFPASLQELIELSASQQDPAVSLEEFLGRYGTQQANHDFSQRPAAGPASTTDLSFPPDHFAPPVARAAITDPVRIADSTALSGKLQPYPWSSARKAQQWLETVKVQQGPRAEWLARQWQTRRANIYIGLAVVILLVVISGWSTRPGNTAVAGNASPARNGLHQAPPQPDLTLFEKLLVNLGLAEAPAAPVYMGNPKTQVWVDVHTALYHCPGSELYGKTPDGRMAAQREAQEDQFEPANRKVCQ